MELHNKKCVHCSGDIPPFTREQIDEYSNIKYDLKDHFFENFRSLPKINDLFFLVG